MMARTSDVIRSATPAVDAELLTQDRLRDFMERGEAPHCDSLIERNGDRRMTCFGAEIEGRLLSFAWFNLGSAEATLNYGWDPATAMPIRLEPDAAFVFYAYTAPAGRGRRLLSAVLGRAAESFQELNGVTALVATSEIVSDAARQPAG